MEKDNRIRRMLVTAVLTAALLLFTGCAGTAGFPGLKPDAKGFRVGRYIDRNDSGASYGTIVYKGRTYMPYGTVGKIMFKSDIGECIGFMIFDKTADTDTRVFTLAEDAAADFLMDKYFGSGHSEESLFWRAADTRGKDIEIPDFIDSLDYAYWSGTEKEQMCGTKGHDNGREETA